MEGLQIIFYRRTSKGVLSIKKTFKNVFPYFLPFEDLEKVFSQYKRSSTAFLSIESLQHVSSLQKTIFFLQFFFGINFCRRLFLSAECLLSVKGCLSIKDLRSLEIFQKHLHYLFSLVYLQSSSLCRRPSNPIKHLRVYFSQQNYLKKLSKEDLPKVFYPQTQRCYNLR